MKILVLGDCIEDNYRFCKATRLSPEAPAPVLVQENGNLDIRAGGASLVYANLRSLFRNDKSVIVSGIWGSRSEKERIFAGRTLICRIDNDTYERRVPEAYLQLIQPEIDTTDIMVIGDYGKGAIEPQLATTLTTACIARRIPLFVDAKTKHLPYRGGYAIFPNEEEHQDIKRDDYIHVIRKLGPRGCEVDGVIIPTEPQLVYDVTGAGDVFLAAFVWQFAMNYNKTYGPMAMNILEHCARKANEAAGVSVRHLGTHIVTYQPNRGFE